MSGKQSRCAWKREDMLANAVQKLIPISPRQIRAPHASAEDEIAAEGSFSLGTPEDNMSRRVSGRMPDLEGIIGQE